MADEPKPPKARQVSQAPPPIRPIQGTYRSFGALPPSLPRPPTGFVLVAHVERARRENALALEQALCDGTTITAAGIAPDGTLYWVPPAAWRIIDNRQSAFWRAARGEMIRIAAPGGSMKCHPMVRLHDLSVLYGAPEPLPQPPAAILASIQDAIPQPVVRAFVGGQAESEGKGTGYAGRPPKGREAIEREFDRRLAAGALAPSKEAQARELRQWHVETFPGASHPTVKTIRNSLPTGLWTGPKSSPKTSPK